MRWNRAEVSKQEAGCRGGMAGRRVFGSVPCRLLPCLHTTDKECQNYPKFQLDKIFAEVKNQHSEEHLHCK